MQKGKQMRKRSSLSHRPVAKRSRLPDSHLIALALLLAFSIFVETYFFYGPSQINAADNFLYTSIARNVASSGTRVLMYGNSVFNSEYILIFGIAAFYELIGPGPLSFAMFGIVTFAGTVLVVYLIGNELYGRKAAMIAALLYSFYPMAVIYGANVSDTGPMAFFAALSVLTMLFAYRRYGRLHHAKNSSNLRYAVIYMLSGMVAVLGLLITAEGIIILLPILAFLLIEALVKKDRTVLEGFGYEIIGVLAGIALIALLSTVVSGDPIHVFSSISGLYTSIQNMHGNLLSYLETMMPYTISSPAVPINYNPDNYLSGYFLYAAIIAAAYLSFKRDKESILPLLWFIVTLLYLSYGTMSLFRYNIIQFATRYAILFAPAMVILVGRAVQMFVGTKKRSKTRTDYMFIARLLISIALIAVVFIQSIYLVWYLSASEYESVYPFIQIGNYINSLPQNTHIVKPYNVYLSAYLNKGYDVTSIGIADSSAVPKGAYLVGGNPQSFPNNCGIGSTSGLEEVFSPGFGNFRHFYLIPEHCNVYNLAVYINNPINNSTG